MSSDHSDRDEDALSGVEQPIDDSGLNKDSQMDHNEPSVSGFARSSSTNSAKKSGARAGSASMGGYNNVGQSEEDLGLAVEGMDELELLCDQVASFEQLAFETKKRVNAMDRLAYKSQLLPPTLRLCYQALQKSWMQDEKQGGKMGFDPDSLDQLIAESIKTSGNCIKEFGKFKGEFYALNEPILNKDISQLSPKFVLAQVNKQQVQVDKLSFIEDHVSENDGQIEELKDKFETFQREKFEEKLNKIEAEGTEVKEMVTETDSQEQNASNIFKDLKGKLKEATPLTRDQRSKHSEVLSKLQKAERKYQKWKTAFDTHSSKQAELHDQIAACQKTVEGLEELSIKTMVAQSKKIQKLVDCSLAIGKYRSKLLALSEESGQILEDAQSLDEQCGNFLQGLQEDIVAEYDDIISKIRQYSQNLEDDISSISESLNKFENKVGEMKISDQDHFFLNKEILRYRTALNSMDSQRSLFMEDTEAIEDKFSMAGTLDDNNHVRQEDLEKLRDNLKHLQKQEEVDLPKIKKHVDGLEQYVMRSLKNQLNGDNKLSQTNISKVKKNYEEFLKQFEKLNHTYNDCVQKVNNFNGKFDSDDLERMNQLKELQERLKEEETGITGSKKAKQEEEQQEQEEEEDEDGTKAVKQSKASEDCLLHTKRAIIEAINGLVNQFNDITKVLRDSSGKSLKAEGPLNDLIAKNKQIQEDCTQTHETIDGAKQAATDIQERLLEIINGEVLEELLQRYRAKETLIEECQKVRVKAEKQQAKLAQQLTKQVELVEEQIKKLDMFNPINGAGTSSSQNQEFLDEISDKIDKTNELMDNLQKLKEDNEQISENIAAACLPLGEVGEREVLSAELEAILETLNTVSTDLSVAEADVGPKTAATAQLQKDVKALIGQEVEGRLKEGQNTLDVVDQDLGGCHDTHGATRKKLKHFREQVEKVSKNQGQRDPQLLETLEEMLLDANQLEDMIGELDTKLNDQKRKKTEARRQMDDMLRGMQGQQKFKPSQLDGVLATLDELKDKNGWIAEKLESAEGKMESKLKELDDLVASCDTKQELQQSIGEAETEIEEDLTNLRELLDRLPTFVRQLQGTVAEMSASAGPGDDFSERKEELAEQLEELEEIEVVVDKFEETFGSLKDERDKMKKQKGKAGDIHQLQKLLEQMQETRDQLSGLFTDALDTQEQLQDLKKDVGDCDMPMLLSKRKTELSQFTTKGERLKKELLNLKKAKQKGQGSSTAADDKIAQMVKEVEFKLKIFDKDRQDLIKTQMKELDTIQALEYDDVGKASELLKRIRKFKNQVLEADQKLKDLEEVHTDIVKKLTEQDLENSTDLLALKAQELRERLKESRLQLQRIQGSGEAMDGNTSTNEEEEFIQALQNEMPEVLDNIETNLGLLVEIEKLVPDVKQSMSLEKMNDLREKVEIATENVEESEGLVIKLEKEILEWNAQKKLCKRDCELEEARNLLNDYLDDLRQEKQNTEIELQRNREKQEENRDQEMVDKDGKKVDIMKDLVKLEQEMEGYVKEIDQLLEELASRETTRDSLQEGFDAAIPQAIIEERQRRAEQSKSLKLPDKQLKRPPMLKKKPTNIRDTMKPHNADGHDRDGLDTHHMLKTNCTFRNPIKDLLKDLKSFNQRRKELEDKYAQMRREVFKLKQIKLYKPVQGDAVDEMFAGYLNKAKLTIEVQRISASNYMFGTKKILAKIINGRLVIRVGGGYMNAEEFIEQYGKIEMMKIMKMKEDEVSAGYEGEGTDENTRGAAAKRGLNNTNTTPGRRATVQANTMINALGDAMKQKMREQLQFVKAYDTQNTQSQRARQTLGGDSMRSLGSSLRQRGGLNNTINKQQTSAEEKARHRETIGNLAKELSNIQSNYRTTQMGDSGGQSARKVGHAQSSLAVTNSLSARGGSKSPNSGVPSANEKTPAKSSSRIGAGFSRKSTALSNTFGGKRK